jgi:hypothetical protein
VGAILAGALHGGPSNGFLGRDFRREGTLGEFFLFMLILFTFGTATAFLVPYLSRRAKGLEGTVDQETLARLLEEVDHLSTRLAQIEEEMAFYKELRGQEEPDLLPAPEEEREGQDRAG